MSLAITIQKQIHNPSERDLSSRLILLFLRSLPGSSSGRAFETQDGLSSFFGQKSLGYTARASSANLRHTRTFRLYRWHGLDKTGFVFGEWSGQAEPPARYLAGEARLDIFCHSEGMR